MSAPLRVALALTGICLAAPVSAAVYRCVVDGQAVYTDRPCAAGAPPHALRTLPAMPGSAPALDESDMAADYDERRERSSKNKRKADAAFRKSHEARRTQEAKAGAAIAEGRAVKDMSTDQVRRALGRPDELERLGGGREEWTYGSGKSRQTLVIEDGRVVKILGKKK